MEVILESSATLIQQTPHELNPEQIEEGDLNEIQQNIQQDCQENKITDSQVESAPPHEEVNQISTSPNEQLDAKTEEELQILKVKEEKQDLIQPLEQFDQDQIEPPQNESKERVQVSQVDDEIDSNQANNIKEISENNITESDNSHGLGIKDQNIINFCDTNNNDDPKEIEECKIQSETQEDTLEYFNSPSELLSLLQHQSEGDTTDQNKSEQEVSANSDIPDSEIEKNETKNHHNDNIDYEIAKEQQQSFQQNPPKIVNGWISDSINCYTQEQKVPEKKESSENWFISEPSHVICPVNVIEPPTNQDPSKDIHAERKIQNEEQKEEVKQEISQIPSDKTQEQEQKPVEQTTEEMIKSSRAEEERVSEMIRQTQESIRKTLESTSRTLESVAKTMDDLSETNKKFDDFTNMYETTMKEFGKKLAESIQADPSIMGALQEENEEDRYMPQITDVGDVASTLKYKNDIVILIGESVSESGSALKAIRSKDFFEQHTSEYWKIYRQLREGYENSAFNDSEQNIAKIIKGLNESNVVSTLVTTACVGSLETALGSVQKTKDQPKVSSDYGDEEEEAKGSDDTKVELNCKDFSEIAQKHSLYYLNGNMNFTRCPTPDCEFQQAKFFNDFQKQSGKSHVECEKCHQKMRPHVKFNEEELSFEGGMEEYGVDWLRAKLAMEFDALVLVGLSEYERGQSVYSEIIETAINNGIIIVEISNAPVLEVGYIRQLVGDVSQTLNYLYEQFE